MLKCVTNLLKDFLYWLEWDGNDESLDKKQADRYCLSNFKPVLTILFYLLPDKQALFEPNPKDKCIWRLFHQLQIQLRDLQWSPFQLKGSYSRANIDIARMS